MCHLTSYNDNLFSGVVKNCVKKSAEEVFILFADLVMKTFISEFCYQ